MQLQFLQDLPSTSGRHVAQAWSPCPAVSRCWHHKSLTRRNARGLQLVFANSTSSQGAGKGLTRDLSSSAHALGREPSRGSESEGSRSSDLDDQQDQHHPVDGKTAGKLLASVGIVGGLVVLAGGAFLLKDHLRAFLDYFIAMVEDYGPLGYVAYMLVYTGLEVLAVPAIPLTMTAGMIFGVVPGTLVVSVAGTLACAISFLIARYLARDKVKEIQQSYPRFAAIDRAIGQDSFRVVALLRLSPLLPLAASNYLYGLTSVEFIPYVLGSWFGMLPGTFAYVSAGKYSKALLAVEGAEGVGAMPYWQMGVGLGVTALAVWYVGRLATKAIAAVDTGLAESD